MERRALTDNEIGDILGPHQGTHPGTLPGWEIRDGKLHKLFKFDSFAEAIGWMVTVSIFADKIDHHPDWSNGYNKVDVELLTHDLGAISTLDVELAKHMEAQSGN